jgi:hypothetical protein
MTQQTIALSRNLVGVLAIVCFGSAAACVVFKLDTDNQIWLAGFIRCGLLLSAFWYAMASKSRAAAWANVSPWTFAGLLLAVFVIPRRPRVFVPLFIVIAIVGYFLRPKKSRVGR